MTVTVANAESAEAATSGCDANYDNNRARMLITSVYCVGGAKIRPWIAYYVSDNTTRLSYSYGPYVRSGSSTASRPSGTFYGGAGAQVVY